MHRGLKAQFKKQKATLHRADGAISFQANEEDGLFVVKIIIETKRRLFCIKKAIFDTTDLVILIIEVYKNKIVLLKQIS